MARVRLAIPGWRGVGTAGAPPSRLPVADATDGCRGFPCAPLHHSLENRIFPWHRWALLRLARSSDYRSGGPVRWRLRGGPADVDPPPLLESAVQPPISRSRSFHVDTRCRICSILRSHSLPQPVHAQRRAGGGRRGDASLRARAGGTDGPGTDPGRAEPGAGESGGLASFRAGLRGSEIRRADSDFPRQCARATPGLRLSGGCSGIVLYESARISRRHVPDHPLRDYRARRSVVPPALEAGPLSRAADIRTGEPGRRDQGRQSDTRDRGRPARCDGCRIRERPLGAHARRAGTR
jgi:hypothetical protein